MCLDGRQSQDVLSTVITAKGRAFADKTKEERGEEKPKHMDGYSCRNQPHMLEAPTARRKDGHTIRNACHVTMSSERL